MNSLTRRVRIEEKSDRSHQGFLSGDLRKPKYILKGRKEGEPNANKKNTLKMATPEGRILHHDSVLGGGPA